MASNPLIYYGSATGLATAAAEIYDGVTSQGSVSLTETGATGVYEATNAELLTGVGGTLAEGRYTIHYKEGSSVEDVKTIEWDGSAEKLVPDASDIADGVLDEAIADHLGAGSTGASLNAAGSAGDPWTTALPGAYGAGTAGFIVGTNIDALVSSRMPTTHIDATGGVVDSVTSIVDLTNTTVADAVWDADIVAAHATSDTAGLVLSQLTHRALATGWTTDITADSALDQIVDNGTAAFDRTTDSLQAIRDRGDASWTTGSGTGLTPLASGTAQGGTALTIQLAAGHDFADDELNMNRIKITSGTGAGQSRRIDDYVGSTDTATVDSSWVTTPDATSVYEVIAVAGTGSGGAGGSTVDAVDVPRYLTHVQKGHRSRSTIELYVPFTGTIKLIPKIIDESSLSSITGCELTGAATVSASNLRLTPGKRAALADVTLSVAGDYVVEWTYITTTSQTVVVKGDLTGY